MWKWIVRIAIVLGAWSVFAQTAPDQLAESSAASPQIAVVADGNMIPNGKPQTWGRPRVLQAFGGTEVLLYAQGLPDTTASVLYDQIWLFRNENDAGGWSSKYDLGTPVRILPSPSGSALGSAPDHNYPHHWPYKLFGRYYMIVQDIAGAPTAENFRYYIFGKSNDGITWTWRKFLKVRAGASLDQITWKDITIGGQVYNYGFVSGTKEGSFGTGAIRFQQTNDGTCDWCFGNNALAIYSSAAWVTAPTCASIGDASGYDFCLYRDPVCETSAASCPANKRIDLDFILSGVRHPSLHRLSKFNNRYELWSQATHAPDLGCGCEDGTTPDTENNNTFAYRTFTPPTSLTTDPSTLLGTPKELAQDSPAVRCMPASARQSRITPFRLEWTTDTLYSRTSDNPSNPFICPNVWGYLVRTKLKTLP